MAEDHASTGYDYLDLLPASVVTSRWLGSPAAFESQLHHTEQRLGATLPPSYRSFLQVSNGWYQPTVVVPCLLPLEELAWFRDRYPSALAPWTKQPIGPIPDDEYFVYGDGQDLTNLRTAYLIPALVISARAAAGTALYLLNPQVVTSEGEWEAWMFAHWLPGAERYRSFWDLMQAERELSNTRG